MAIPLDTPSPGRKQVDKPKTALQSHVAFFDRDGDGIIWASDTFAGFRALGFGLIFSVVSAIIIHVSFSWPTFGPDPLFRLRVEHIHKAKHGSDSEIYTALGEFDENRFNYIFDLYSAPPHTHLSFSEGVRMVHGNRKALDPFGWVAAIFEWYPLYIILSPPDGRMAREDVHAMFDGSIFYKLSGWKIE